MKKLLAATIFIADLYILGNMVDYGLGLPASIVFPIMGVLILTIPVITWLATE